MEKSWFNKLREWMAGGVNIAGRIHKLSPVKAQSKKSWAKEVCPKCGSGNGFVFRSHTDGTVWVVGCFNCKKYTVLPTKTKPYPICKAVTLKGVRCKNKSKSDGYCAVHGG